MSVWKQYAKASLAVRATVALAITLSFLLIPALADGWTYHHVWHRNVYALDWARLLRVMGFWPTWVIVAIAIWLVERETNAPLATRRAWLLVGSPAVAGLLCEVLKLVIRRERPAPYDGEWIFRPWSEHPWSTAGLATPSSHAMVAFGAATLLARMFPRAKCVFYAMAWGCGITRLLDHAHFLSDVTFGALLGWAVGWGLWMQFTKSQPKE